MSKLTEYKSAETIGAESDMQYHEEETRRRNSPPAPSPQFLLAAPGRHYAAFPTSGIMGDMDLYEVVAWVTDDDDLAPMVYCGGLLRRCKDLKGYGGLYVQTTDNESGWRPAEQSCGFVNHRVRAVVSLEEEEDQ